ncbi:MAG: response regulator transcription factor [Flavobacteriales bacterium]
MPARHTILIIEDEVLIAEHLHDILKSCGYEHVKLVHDKESAIAALKYEIVSLALLDIRMDGEHTGIELAKTILDDYQIPFIFITAHSDNKVLSMALDTNPASYITKPFKKPDVEAAVRIALSQSDPNHKRLHFKDGWNHVWVDHDDIFYAKSDGNYIELHTLKKRYTVRYTLDWLVSQLPEDKFIRVHRTSVVNKDHVEALKSGSVIVKGEELPVSRSNQPQLKDLMKN